MSAEREFEDSAAHSCLQTQSLFGIEKQGQIKPSN